MDSGLRGNDKSTVIRVALTESAEYRTLLAGRYTAATLQADLIPAAGWLITSCAQAVTDFPAAMSRAGAFREMIAKCHLYHFSR